MSMLLQDWLQEAFPQASKTTLRKMLETGRVRVNGAVVRRMKQTISADDQIRVAERNSKARPPVRGTLHPMKLVFEDEQVLVIDKPAGLLTSTVPRERRPTALVLVRKYLSALEWAGRVGLIHRLDRDASGLLVFSKTDLAYRWLKQQFFEHAVERIYTAITHGIPTPASGRIELRLVELPDGTVRSSRRSGAGEQAITEYTTIAREGGMAALRVRLHTGRKHQIRVHLSERGVPIVGDRVYGKPDGAPRLMLSASTLGFVHPTTGAALRFELAIPSEFPIVGGTNPAASATVTKAPAPFRAATTD
jgi:23S rRNA pseudouridine1911/1915/1917 synthase